MVTNEASYICSQPFYPEPSRLNGRGFPLLPYRAKELKPFPATTLYEFIEKKCQFLYAAFDAATFSTGLHQNTSHVLLNPAVCRALAAQLFFLSVRAVRSDTTLATLESHPSCICF